MLKIKKLNDMKRYILIFLILLGAGTAMAGSPPVIRISDLSVTTTGTVRWWDASTGGTEITDLSTPLVDGKTYYASQTVNGVESTARKAVTVTFSATTANISETWVTSVNSTSSQFNMTINVTNATVTGYKYSTTAGFDPDASGNDVSNITTPTTYTGQNPTNFVTGLSSGTTYYVRAYATNACGTSYGAQMNFVQLAIGDTYQGGKIFYILKSGDTGYDSNVTHGLIASTTDFGSGWSNITGTFVGTATAIGTGLANSDKIIKQSGHTTSAAKSCLDLVEGGYDDWYLPSLDEFTQLKINHLTAGISLPHLIAGDGNDGYWTSSEVDYQRVYIYYHNEPSYNNYTKSNWVYSRAIRSF